PDLDQVRHAMDKAGLKNPRIQRFGPISDNEVLIDLGLQETSESALDKGKNAIVQALQTENPANQGKQDLNNSGVATLEQYLLQKDPLHLGTDAATQYQAMAHKMEDFRNKEHGGVLNLVDDLRGIVPAEVV